MMASEISTPDNLRRLADIVERNGDLAEHGWGEFLTDAAQEIEDAEVVERHLVRSGAQMPSEPAASFCPECGFNIECDEDGCCVTCGATAMGEAVKALRVFSAQWRQAPTEEADE